jgi:hypothetical protein
MAFRGLLRHQLAIVTPGVADITNLDDAGFPVVGSDSVRLVPGLVQPRDAHEAGDPIAAGTETSDFLIFLEMMPLSIGAYITEADDDGPRENGRRFQVNGIQPFDYGSSPHLEVYATLIGSTEYIPGS